MSRGLEAISDTAWDNLGVLFGCAACATIGHQILHEWRTSAPTSVSMWFAVGFLVIYTFWCLYGIRFRRRGIWLPNGLAAVLQIVFAGVILAKG